MEVRTRLMSSERQFGNQAKLGFVPTSKDIVEMELNLIDFSDISENDFPVNICDLSGGTGDQIHWTSNYLISKGIRSNVFYNELSEERFNTCQQNYPYMNTLNCDFFNLKVGNKNNRNFKRDVFSIIRNNPPYMYIEKQGKSVRAEVEFFLKNTLLDIAGGIHILEVPLHQLLGIKSFMKMICYRYDVFIAKFPREVFINYKQVAVICKKKAIPSNNNEELNNLYMLLENDQLPYINEVHKKIFKVNREDFKKAKEINIFRENKVTQETLANGLNEVLDSLILSDRKTNRIIREKEKLKPIIELLPGHISQLLASGRYDNIMGNLLIRGGANKVIETEVISEKNKESTIQTEVLKPFVEITNKNGDILYKNF